MRNTNIVMIFCIFVYTLHCTNAIGVHWTDYVKPGLQRINGKSAGFGDESSINYRVYRPSEEEEFVFKEHEHKEVEQDRLSEENLVRKARLLSLLKELLHETPSKRSIGRDIFKLKEKYETS